MSNDNADPLSKVVHLCLDKHMMRQTLLALIGMLDRNELHSLAFTGQCTTESGDTLGVAGGYYISDFASTYHLTGAIAHLQREVMDTIG